MVNNTFSCRLSHVSHLYKLNALPDQIFVRVEDGILGFAEIVNNSGRCLKEPRTLYCAPEKEILNHSPAFFSLRSAMPVDIAMTPRES